MKFTDVMHISCGMAALAFLGMAVSSVIMHYTNSAIDNLTLALALGIIASLFGEISKHAKRNQE
jgi:hypothetical protein